MEQKFICDFMLGRLGRWLRILGYDTDINKHKSSSKILMQSLKEQRIILTRNTKLSNKKAFRIILIKSDNFREQIKQLINEIGLTIKVENLFTICSFCNIKVNDIADKKSIKSFVPEYVYQNNESFSQCPICSRVYWKGTHYNLLIEELKKMSAI